MGGENRNGNRKGRPAWEERDQEQGKGGFGASRAGSGKRREKRLLLVGDVQEYWRFYEGEGEGNNTVWIL